MGLIIMDKHMGESIKDCTKMLDKLILVNKKEAYFADILTNNLSELYYLKNTYIKRCEHIKKDGIKDFNHYLPEIQQEKSQIDIACEFSDVELSSCFKSFLIFTKSILDKMIKLMKYRYPKIESSFENRGKKLITFIQSNKYTGINKKDLCELIKHHKEIWIDTTISLRDNYTHNSNLKEYKNFHFIISEDNSQIKDVKDLFEPAIYIDNTKIDAIEFINTVYTNLISFINDVLKLSGFDKYNKIEVPKTCKRCNSDFSKGKIDVNVINKEFCHIELICPSCKSAHEGFYKHLPKHFN